MRHIILFVAVLWCFALPAEGAVALVANTSAQSDGCNVTSGAIDTTGSNLLLIYVAWTDSASGTLAVSDSKTNTWTALTASGVFNARGTWYYATNTPTVGGSHTFTVNCAVANTRHAISVTAWSGAHATAPFDQQSGAALETVTSVQPGSITPTQNDEVVVVGLTWNDVAISALAINGGFTKLHEVAANTASPFQRGLGMGYLIQTTAAAANPTWSWTTNADVATRIASFKADGGGGGGGCVGGLLLLGAGKC